MVSHEWRMDKMIFMAIFRSKMHFFDIYLLHAKHAQIITVLYSDLDTIYFTYFNLYGVFMISITYYHC